ncbi:MAG: medium chain dehydrogenase/reductase family protein [Terriglobia bacterium]
MPRSVFITKLGPPEVLQIQEVAETQPKPQEVRVHVRASGVNFADIMMRLGLYAGAPPLPFVPGYEVSGTIDRLGSGVKGRQIGDRVIAMTEYGGYTESVCVAADRVVSMPATMSFEQGAALPVNYLTAYHMLYFLGHVRKGERVLIHQAAGGVGLAALELCKVAGAETFGTASASKKDFLISRGLHHHIDYHTQDYEQEVQRITQGEGVEIVLDPIGGESLRKGYRILAPLGRLMVFGFSSSVSGKRRNLLNAGVQFLRTPKFSPMDMMLHNRAVFGVHLGRLWNAGGVLAEEVKALLDFFDQGKISPHVGSTFLLNEADAAHHFIQDRKNLGKVILLVD